MKSVSFNDFSKLILKGSQNFCTYGEYVAKNRNTVFGKGYCTPIPQNRKITREEISIEVLTKAKGLSLGYS